MLARYNFSTERWTYLNNLFRHNDCIPTMLHLLFSKYVIVTLDINKFSLIVFPENYKLQIAYVNCWNQIFESLPGRAKDSGFWCRRRGNQMVRGVTPHHHIRVVVEMHLGGQKWQQGWVVPLAIMFMWLQEGVGGRNDSEGGWYTSPSLSCGHRKA